MNEALKLGYYEDETVVIDMREGYFEIKFKQRYSKVEFQNTLLIIESVVDALNELKVRRSKNEDNF